MAFVFWVKVLLDLLKLSNFFSINPIPKKSKIICFDFKKWKMIEFEEKFFKGLSLI